MKKKKKRIGFLLLLFFFPLADLRHYHDLYTFFKNEDPIVAQAAAAYPDPAPISSTSRGDGLAIVVRMLDQMAGRLEIMSSPGDGTTIWVTLPVNPAREEGSRATPDTARSRFERVVRIRPRA